MTTANAPYPRGRAFARGWRRLRRWSRGRPFWGGLLTIVSAVAFFVSGHLTLANIKISFSPQEFLGWMIPLILALCGLLMLFTPAQRVFYGVLAAAVSVGGLIGLNLGGFLVGMLLGMIGGALGASWTPVALPPVAPIATGPAGGVAPEPPEHGPEPDADPDPYWGTAPDEDPLPIGHDVPDGPEVPDAGAPVPWQRPSGPLTDTLPTSMVSPLATPAPAAGPPTHDAPTNDPSTAGAEPDGDPGPPPSGRPLPRRSPRGLAAILLVLTVAAVGATTLRLQAPAGAAPSCAELFASLAPTPTTGSTAKPTAKTTPKTTGAGKTAGAGTPTGGAKPPAGAGPTTTDPAPPSPTASGGPTGVDAGDDNRGGLGGVVQGVLGGLGHLLGIGSDPAPSTSPTPTPTTSPGPAPSGTGRPPTAPGQPPTGTAPATAPSTPKAGGPPATGGRTPRASGSPTASGCPIGDPNALVPPLDDTVVAQHPSLQITADLSLLKMTYKGVTELPIYDGTKIRVLEFTMNSSSSTPFELRVPMVTAGDHTLSYKSSKLTVTGHVNFYTTRITGNLYDFLPVTFTPAAPPPLPPVRLPVPVVFTDATLELVLVHADVLTAPALDISYIS